MGAYDDDGQWRWRRQIRVQGQKRRGSGTPPINTKRAALAAEHEWIEEQLSGRRAPVEVPTLAAVHEKYLAHVKAHRSYGLWVARKSYFRKHLVPMFGRMCLDRIGLIEIDRLKTAKTEAGLAPGTINLLLVTLTNLLRWAEQRGWVSKVPRVEPLPPADPDPDAEEVEHLADAELAALLDRAAGELRTMILVAVHTGMRIGELLALRWADVDLKAGRVVVRHNTYRGQDRPPKNKRYRVVPLSETAQAALKAHRHLRGPLVFCEDDGRRTVYCTARDRALRVGLPGWHLLRHTFGTTLSAHGVPLRAIQEWMGHASIKTTMVYAHYAPVFDEAIGVLDGKTWQPRANASGGGQE